MRREWTQREVIEMANLLGFKNFDRRSLHYYSKTGVFPEPRAKLENVLVLYADQDVNQGLMGISKKLRNPIPITDSDVEWAKKEVLKTNKAKNASMFLRKLKQKEVSNGR
jgi:hypothetical protein